MTAAIFSALKGDNVTIIEHNDRLGKKLLATGNGRCNLTNRLLEKDIDSHFCDLGCADRAFYEHVITAFGYNDTIRFFKELGLMFKYRQDLVYPNSDQASSVLDALRFKIRELGIDTIFECNVTGVCKENDTFVIRSDKGIYKCDKLILATGSKAMPSSGSDGSGYRIAESFGHTIDNVRPGLVQIKSDEEYFKSVSGVRCAAALSLYDDNEKKYEERGELQFTDYGISGIAAMNLSNRLHVCKGTPYVHVDFLNDIKKEELTDILTDRKRLLGRREAQDFMTGIVNKKLGIMLLKSVGIKPSGQVSDIADKELLMLAENLKDFVIRVDGTKGFEQAQICMGGVSTAQIDENMQSRIVPSLYFCGEIINLHGDCGGYNLQLAWSTGAIAGGASKR